MKLLDNVDYYEVLEISRDASPSDIRQARQKLLALYQNNPVVADSFFNVEEKKQIIEAVETAFAVLSDPDKKSAYDQAHYLEPPSVELQEEASPETFPEISTPSSDKQGGVVSPLLPDGRPMDSSGIMKKIEDASLNDETQHMLSSISKQETISGQDIQSLRASLDLSVEQVFELTKIRGPIIQAIEENRFDDLPPGVYLKSFLKNYAQVLCLAPDKLTDGYLKHMAALKAEK